MDTDAAGGEGEESLFDGTAYISGRPSRRIPAPLRLFLGNTWSANSGTTTGVVDVLERQPSPLQSILRVEKDEEGYFGSGEGRGRSNTRLSVDTTRPSMESEYRRICIARNTS
ncbi:hypothetical protein D9756_007787 [Leucocoprinus leucothites]|uniref:Uncharacterized protein n=1 Tax=Leucocoprinus leucothites TaxID=201217 RepID=A0A8H5D5G1_9AGAR|nr:hypothetical protein D9756_007787 [Leucoagaricus leucothites]